MGRTRQENRVRNLRRKSLARGSDVRVKVPAKPAPVQNYCFKATGGSYWRIAVHGRIASGQRANVEAMVRKHRTQLEDRQMAA